MCLLCELEPAGRRIIIIKLDRLEEKTLALEAPRPQRPHNTICRGVARRAGLLEQLKGLVRARRRRINPRPDFARFAARCADSLVPRAAPMVPSSTSPVPTALAAWSPAPATRTSSPHWTTSPRRWSRRYATCSAIRSAQTSSSASGSMAAMVSRFGRPRR